MVEYKVYLTTKVNPAKLEAKKVNPRPIIVIEPEDYKAEEVQAIRKKGYRVLAYLSLGTNEKGRSWYNTYNKYNLSRLEDWPDEYYVDVRRGAWQEHLVTQAKKYKEMPFLYQRSTSSSSIIIASLQVCNASSYFSKEIRI